jgi:pyruvate kinase
MIRRTKIVATLGPATDNPQILREIINAGLDVARINFSHGEQQDHRARIEALRAAAAECGREIGLMGDLQGPKIRVKRFKDSKVSLKDGAKFFLDESLGLHDGNDEGVGVAYPRLHEDVKPGDVLLLNDGQITLKVDSIEGTRVHTTVVLGGILSDHKGVNRQGGGLSAPALTDTDREYIQFAADMGMDFLAVSFVRNAGDVTEARELFRAAGGQGGGGRAYRFHHRSCRRHHGCPWRSRRRNGLCRANRHAKTHHPPDANKDKNRYHGNPDDGVDDQNSDSDES